MNKKILSLVLALIMIFSLFTPAFAEEKTEKTDAVEAAAETAPVTEEFIEFLKEHKIIEGDAKGDLMLDKEIDRASFAALLARMDNKEDAAKAVQSLPSRFKDMSSADWANGYANLVADQGWMKGNEKGEFMPRKNISYAEIATTLVRFLGTDTAGYVYPTRFISKAFELGLWDGVRQIENYNQPAIRKDIFRMVYNAISREDFGRYTVYKMIVLENNRVAQLGANEIKAEILDVVQMPNKVSERGIGKVGEQIKFNIEGLKLDTEFLLGKVANFSIDEDGKLVKVVVDETYDYVWGGFRATEKNFGIAGRNYGVRVDERYWKIDGQRYDNDDRMYRTYVTSGIRAANFHYIDFVKQIKDKKIAPNMARVTAKDGMVIFIDAFAYTDIAPVKEVARDGKDVYYYNDARDGAVEVMEPSRRIIGYSEKEGFHNMKASDIKANDVIHWMTGFTLVRRDAELTGKLEKTFRNKWGEFAVIGEDEYFLNSAEDMPSPFRSVYAYDNTNFRTLPNRGAIEDMRGDDVVVLLDVMGDIQLISSHRKYSDNVALINRVVSSKGQGYIAPNKDENYTLAEDWNSNYVVSTYEPNECVDVDYLINTGKYSKAGTREQRFHGFDYLDLVYVQSHEEKIATSAVMVPFNVYNACMKFAAFESRYGRSIKVGGKEYRFNQDTDVFAYRIDDRGQVWPIKADMQFIYEKNRTNVNLKAFVLTEKEYKHYLEKVLGIKTYNRLSERDDLARVIIFKDFIGEEKELGALMPVKVVRVNNYSNSIVVETSRGVTEELDIYNFGDFDLNSLRVGEFGDFVYVRKVYKDGQPTNEAKFIEVLKMRTVEIVKRYNDGFVTADGDRVYIDKYTLEFGSSRDKYARIYQFEGSNYAEVVDYFRDMVESPEELTDIDKIQIETFKTLVGIVERTNGQDATAIAKARKAYNELSKRAKEEVAKENAKLIVYENLADPATSTRVAYIEAVNKAVVANENGMKPEKLIDYIIAAETIYDLLPNDVTGKQHSDVVAAKAELDKFAPAVKATIAKTENEKAKAKFDAFVTSVERKYSEMFEGIMNAETLVTDKVLAELAGFRNIYTAKMSTLRSLLDAGYNSANAAELEEATKDIKKALKAAEGAYSNYLSQLLANRR